MKRFSFILILTLFLAPANVNSQVVFSESFKNTIDKIVRENASERIINWITEKEPIIGIVGRDLIGQVINSGNDLKLIRSGTNVVMTMILLNRAMDAIEKFIDDHPTALAQAEKFGWDKRKLVAYSAMYFYYSERLKHSLFVSPYILELSRPKEQIESIIIPHETIDDFKWVRRVSVELLKVQDISLDVRAYELLQYCFIQLVQGKPFEKDEFNIVGDLIKKYGDQRLNRTWIKLWNENGNLTDIMPAYFKVIVRNFEQKIGEYSRSYNHAEIPFYLVVAKNFILPYANYIANLSFSIEDREQFKNQLLTTMRTSLETWLEDSGTNKFRFGYDVMLASTYVDNRDEVEFTVIDQLKFGYFRKKGSIFLFATGVIDPLLKQTINEDGNKIYFGGLGFEFRNFNLLLGGGIPYEDIKIDNMKFSAIFGYRIPITDIINR